jgi:DNA invertase Pin-like site-specific DNA recombinase
MKVKKIYKAIGLIRVSTDAQAKTNDSIAGQKKHIIKWAKENNIDIEKIYVEPGNSAFRGRRPILEHILNEIEEGIVNPNAVLVYAYSRFTRKAAATANFKSKLNDKNIAIISVTEPLPDDEDSAFISQTVIDMVNELQSRVNSKIVQDRLNDTADGGYFTGGVVPFGYTSTPINIANTKIIKKKLVINPKESEVVATIFDLADFGVNGKPLGVKVIAKMLNDKNITYRGKRWTKNNIDNILNKTLYYGDKIYGNKRITRADLHSPIIVKIPPIITKYKFSSVNKGLKERLPLTNKNEAINTHSKGTRSKSLLVGLLVCEQCGSNLRLMNGKRRDKNDPSSRYKYYACPKRTTDGCSCPNIRKDLVDKLIIDTILMEAINDKVIKEIYSEIKDKISDSTKLDKNKLLQLQRDQISVKLKLDNLYEMLSNDKISLDDTLTEHLNNKRHEFSNINSSIEDLKYQLKLPLKKFGKAQINRFVEVTKMVLAQSNQETSKQILIKIIDKILVRKEKIEVYCGKFKLVEFVSKTKMGTSKEVPIFVSMWR